MFDRCGPMIAQEQLVQSAVDLRFGFVPLPGAAPGYGSAADAKGVMFPGLASPATVPIPGMKDIGSYAPGQRFVVRVPREIV